MSGDARTRAEERLALAGQGDEPALVRRYNAARADHLRHGGRDPFPCYHDWVVGLAGALDHTTTERGSGR